MSAYEVIEAGDSRKSIIVPYWEWQRRQEEVFRILSKHNSETNSGIFWGLSLIKDCLETCDCIITDKTIEISPKGVDIEKITSFAYAQRRIFMSATLADDSVFVSSLGLDKGDVSNIITPENADDIGDRLILFPKCINNNITDEDIKRKVEEIAEIYNVVILVPSFNRARFWDADGKSTVNKENIVEVVDELKSKKHLGIVVIVNRYDGIDLPDDSCRLLVIDGLPPLNSLKDRYIQSIAPQSAIFLREQVQRIEQGMGRGVRSNDDECCIVLMGAELSNVLTRNRGVDYFSIATHKQYNLSKQLWDLLVEESNTKPTVDQIFELAHYSLEKKPEWVAKCKETLSNIRYSKEPQIDGRILALRKAFDSSLKNQWEEAASFVKKAKDAEEDSKTKGFLCQILAEYTNEYDSVLSQKILRAGKKLSGAILTPIDGIYYEKIYNNIPQVQAVKKFIDVEKLNSDELMLFVDSALSNLVMGSEYNKFEEAVDTIGKLLGFSCSRPDKETRGCGPDNLWALGDNCYFVIECKNEAVTNLISKRYCDQLSGSVNWFYENYSNRSICQPIMVHPSNVIDDAASPVNNMLVVTERELSLFRKNIRDFFASLNHNGSSDDERVYGLLKMYNLRKEDIIKCYTVKFVRR